MIAGSLLRLFCVVAVFVVSANVVAVSAADTEKGSAQAAAYEVPRWALAFKGGKFKPDLDLYEEFYGRDTTNYWALSGAWRINNWVEIGGELGYSRDNGSGTLPSSGAAGGQVEYTLMPLQLFANLYYEQSENQLFVPYIGVGLVAAWYKQKIEQQSGRDGRTDLGGSARVGLQLLLNRLDPRSAQYLSGQRRLQSFLFVEGQYYTAEVDSIDLGGEILTIGLRMEFD
jgi:hypothetical protein